jgi:hypothetical protein
MVGDTLPAGHRPRPGRGFAALVAVAAAGAALGFLAASNLGTRTAGDTELAAVTTTSTTRAPRPTHDPDPAVASPPATTRPATPQDLLPGFDATFLMSTGDALVWWRADMAEPAQYPLPRGARASSVEWDAAGARVAFVGRDAAGRESVLWAGARASQDPVAIGVEAFAWDVARPGHLAWIEVDPASHAPVLSTATDGPDGLVAVRVASLPVAEDAIATAWWLAGWSEWGFAMTRFDYDGFGSGAPTALALDANGTVTAEAPGRSVFTASPGGLLQVWESDPSAEDGGTRTISGLDLQPRPDFRVLNRAAFSVAFASDDRYATVGPEGESIIVVSAAAGPITYPIRSDGVIALLLAWSPDDRYIGYRFFNRDHVGVLDVVTGDTFTLDPGPGVLTLDLG